MFLLALLMTIPAMAQKQLFTGIVKDALGEPVIVSVSRREKIFFITYLHHHLPFLSGLIAL